MTGAELAAEYFGALRQTQPSDLAPLREAGVDDQALALVKPAIARIRLTGHTYEPDPEEGGRAFLIPVRVYDCLTPEAPDPAITLRAGAIIDLLAMHPRFPARWAQRCGAADWLGSIGPQFLQPPLVHVRPTPLSWLRAGSIGLCILSSEPASAYRILAGCTGLIAEDHRHQAELRAILSRPWPLPRIIVRAEARCAA